MSLINQMLKDLESRKQQARGGSGSSPAAGVSAAESRPVGGSRKWLLAVGILLLAAAAFWIGRPWFSPAAPPALPQAAPPAEQLAAPVEPAPSPAFEAPPVVAEIPGPQAQAPSTVLAVLAEPEPAPAARAAEPAAPRVPEVSAKPSPQPAKPAAEPPPAPAAVPAPASPKVLPAPPPVQLSTLRMTEQAGYLRLVAFFEGVPDYRLRRDEARRRLVIELPNTRFSGSAPVPPQGSGLVRAIEVERGEGQLRLVLQMKREYRFLEQFESKERRFGERLILDLYAAGPLLDEAPAPAEETRAAAAVQTVEPPRTAAPAPAAAEGEIAKSPRSVSAAQQAANLEARQLLVERLLGSGRLSEAEALLAEGASLHPGHAPFRRGYARLLVDRGELTRARDLLVQGGLPEVRSEPEHHALLAAVYQRLGEFGLAEQAYRRVLSAAPSSGVWWMGLGIALESQGRSAEAAEAYAAALRSGNLGADLKAYVQGRLAALPR